MTDAAPAQPHAFVLPKQAMDPSQHPLEVYHLSHDLRGPLNSILGFAELLLEGIEGPLNETQEADIAAIYQSAQNLLYLINTMVDLSKLEANRLSFDLKSIDLPGVIEALLPDILAAKPEPIEFAANIPLTLPAILADRERLEQLLKSLFKFAFRSTKKGPLSLAAQPDATAVTLRLEIGQVGLPPAEVAELFELVVKVDPSGRSHLAPGGLELPLARHLAQKQQGRVWAESQSSGHLVIYLAFAAYESASQP